MSDVSKSITTTITGNCSARSSVRAPSGLLVKRLTKMRSAGICNTLAKVLQDPVKYYKSGDNKIDIEAVARTLVVYLNKMNSRRAREGVTASDVTRWLSKHKRRLIKSIESINKTTPMASDGSRKTGVSTPRYVCTLLNDGLKIRLNRLREVQVVVTLLPISSLNSAFLRREMQSESDVTSPVSLQTSKGSIPVMVQPRITPTA